MPTKYKVKMKNCYGIPDLTYEFSFNKKNKLVAIYAPNGLMKTSFARSFKDYSQNKSPMDIVYPDKKSIFQVHDQNGNKIKKGMVFVVGSITEEYSSNKISTLLASKELKAKYDKIHKVLMQKRDLLLQSIKEIATTTTEVEKSFTSAVELPESKFIDALRTVKSEVKNAVYEEFTKVTYDILFNPKVVELLENADMKQLISEYSKELDQLRNESKYIYYAQFTNANANQVVQKLKDNGPIIGDLTALHEAEDEFIEISDKTKLQKCINEGKQRILNDSTLSEILTKISGRINTTELQNFRDYLHEHPYLVRELRNINGLRRRVWIAYLISKKFEYFSLLSEHDQNDAELKRIVDEAKSERTQWESVFATFNDRFWVPFDVEIKNKVDVVLGIDRPQIDFVFKNSGKSKSQHVTQEKLLEILSNGELKALYILNIIYEVETRLAANNQTLMIVDDIADSFDYKNKYAIVEYLRDISRMDHFYLVVLTHNFDFFRTVSGRLNVPPKMRLVAGRTNSKIALNKNNIAKIPMKQWINSLHDPKSMIGCIPFVRNLAEFAGNTGTCKKLTSLLHIKEKSDRLTFGDLELMFRNVLSEQVMNNCYNCAESVLKKVSEICDGIVCSPLDEVSLLDKVILSIGIRLEAERFIINQIQDQTILAQLKVNQTYELICRYRSENPNQNAINVLEQVLLMTPENIHINSFMFEPILDMSPRHLHKLYKNVKSLS